AYGGARLVARRDIAHRVADKVAEADRELGRARVASAEGARLESEAFARFDDHDPEHAEPVWEVAHRRGAEAANAYAQASRALEAAVLLDGARDDVRQQLAAVTYERIALDDREYRRDERDDLVNRLALYDDGTFTQRL